MKTFLIVISIVLGLGFVPCSKAQDDPCVRSIPEPMLDHKLFKDAKFILNKKKRIGIETVTLPNGDKLKLENCGCETFTILFTLSSSKTEFSKSKLDVCYVTAAQTLTEISHNNKMPWTIRRIVGILKKCSSHPPKLGKEINIEPGEIPTAFVMDSISDKHTIHFHISTGPL